MNLKSILCVLVCLNLIHTASSKCLLDPEQVVPFCTEDNEWGISYAANTSGELAFTNAVACIKAGSAKSGAWFIMQIDEPGDLGMTMTHTQNSDLDFVCFGPFEAETKNEVIDYLCANEFEIFYNGLILTYTNDLLHKMEAKGCKSSPDDLNSPVVYDITSPCFRGNFDEYPLGLIADCSSSHYSTELCYLPNTKSGEWYVLFIANYSCKEGTINFKKTSGAATTVCDIIVDAYSTGPYCEGSDIQLGIYNAPAKATFLWTGPNGFTSTMKDPVIPHATPKNAGDYKVVMYNNGLETPEVVVPVEVYAKDTTIIEESITAEEIESFTFNDKNFTESGSYKFPYKSHLGCDSLVILNLEVVEPEDTIVRMPIIPKEHFSPNDDGVEDLWTIENIEQYPEAKIRIYDRSGRVLFETKGYDNTNNAWDGTYKGNACPSDDYWFVIDIESLDKQFKGHFTLIRG